VDSKFASLRIKGMMFTLMITIIPITIIALIGFQAAQDQIQASFNPSQLRSEAFERGNALRILFEDRVLQGLLITTDTRFHELILNPDDSGEIKEILKQELLDVAKIHEGKAGLISLQVFDIFGNKVLSIDNSAGDVVVPLDQSFFELSKHTIKFGQAENGQRILLLVGPIFENNDQTKRIGILVVVLDISLTDRILLARSGLGDSGETYLVNEEMMLISDSRFIENAAFNVKVDTLGVRNCFEDGQEVEAVYDDYRGILIHGVSYCAPDLGWVLLAEIDEQEVNAPLVNLIYTYIFVGVILIIGSFGLGSYFIRNKIKPILELTKATSKVIEGNYDVQVKPHSKDEIGNLQEHFNKMIHSLQSSTKHIEKLKEIESLKDEFTSMIAHELKSPLTPIIGWVDALRDPDISGDLTDIQKEAVNAIESNALKLQRVIGDLLDAQKLEMGRMSFSMEKLSVNQVLNQVVKDYQNVSKEKNIQITSKIDEEIVIFSDRKRIDQVLDNLIRNSIDFVPKDTGTIQIFAEKNKDDVIITVKDNGKGISKEAQKKLFTKFYQVDTSAKRKHGGTGLGLSICKGIVEQLGGKIWVSSIPGKQTSFSFSIPIGDVI